MRNIGIWAVLLLSAVLNLARLDREGFANLYYAAGVKSMMLNWHNFFFAAFDPAGFISIDKPPLGFWLQVISAKLFGFQGWSLILPQAAGGVAAVYLMYRIVRRQAGRTAGTVAALILAVTPIFVAASRNNTIDGLLLLAVLLAARWLLMSLSDEQGHRLYLSFFMVGIGFNIKSMQAFMVLPAFYITYFLFAGGRIGLKLQRLALASVLLAAVALPWYLAVDYTPPEKRPYAGSSANNSTLELAGTYNGLGHFLGYSVKVPGRSQGEEEIPQETAVRSITLMETGEPGSLRFFNRQLGGQIGWLLPLAVCGMMLGGWLWKNGELNTKGRSALVFWGSWLVPQVVFFSIAEAYHRYYLIMMAPAVAALCACSWRRFFPRQGEGGRWAYAFPGLLLVNGLGEIAIASQTVLWRSWVLPLVTGLVITSSALNLWAVYRRKMKAPGIYRAVTAAALAALLTLPLLWAVTPLWYSSGNARSIPFAGPELMVLQRQTRGNPPRFDRLSPAELQQLTAFLQTQARETKFLAAVPNAQVAAPLIMNTGQAVLTYGGFLGAEKILTVEALEELTRSGQLRYVLLTGVNRRQPVVEAWVKERGKMVPVEKWLSASPPESAAAVARHFQLYDCRAAAASDQL